MPRLRPDVLWYDGWLRRLSDHYSRPIFELERMPIGALHREIAILIADSIIREAARLRTKTSDRKTRRELDREWATLKKSKDWYDRLIREKVELDAKRA